MISLPKLDYNEVFIQISKFLNRAIENSNAKGFVIGVSGGIDSSVTATVAAKSFEKVLALIMPEEDLTPKEDVEDAIKLCERLSINYKLITINEIKQKILEKAGFKGGVKSVGNISARIRMILLYYYANDLDYLVLGTGDKSEILMGYYTKYGDGGVDLLPIGDLYKTQVREFGKFLGIDERIIKKKSSPRLWEGQEAEQELGISYELLDKILYALVDLEMPIKSIAEELKISEEIVLKIYYTVKKNEHKRRGPILCQLGLKGIESGYKLPSI